MTFRAKYDGKCASCGEIIRAGDLLDWDDDTAVHAGCLDRERPRTVARPTCPECWQEKSLSGACGCDPE